MFSLLSSFISYITTPLYSLIQAPTWFFAAPGKIMGLSTPWRVAIFVAIVSTCLVCSVVALQNLEIFESVRVNLFGENKDYVTRSWSVRGILLLLIVGLSAASGVATYFWLVGEPSRFPEIDEAWNQGLNELSASGIDITDAPLYLVLGFPDVASASALMQASGLKQRVKPTSLGEKPLAWFSLEREEVTSVFVFLFNCCQISCISGGRGLAKGVAAASGGKSPSGKKAGNPLATLANDGGDDSEHTALNSLAAGGNFNPNDTDAFDEPTSADKTYASEPNFQQTMSDESSVVQRGAGAANRTIDDSSSVLPRTVSQSKSKQAGTASYAGEVIKLDPAHAQKATERLAHVCRKLVFSRQPYCPCNGLIVSAPFERLKCEDSQQGTVLGDATRSDIKTITKELGLRAHALALVHGLDTDEDFRVFVKRMRTVRSPADVDRRVGRGLSTWTATDAETIEKLADCSCDAFQKLIYEFFKQTHALTRVDNGQLYRFLAKIRGKVARNLGQWLEQGFAPTETKDNEPVDQLELPQFAGCYFVAAQPVSANLAEEDRLFAHVPGVFEKIVELESEIEWTQKSLERDYAYRSAANFFLLLSVAAICVAVIALYNIVTRFKTAA